MAKCNSLRNWALKGYFEIQHATIQQQNYKYTIQFMHTWILKDEQVATYIAPEKKN